MNQVIKDFCAPGSACAPRLTTDRFFPLSAGSSRLTGPLMENVHFIEKVQLLDGELWKLFVDQFRQGDADVADNGWRCEYWGKMMRGACFTYQCTHNDELYALLEETVRDMLSTQDAQGRISTYTPDHEFTGWDIWGRKYVLLGMQYFLEICRDEALAEQVLAAMVKHADYMLEKLGPAEEGKLEINEATCHWKGLNSSSVLEPMVRMYNLTGEKRYLEFADYIVSRGGTSVANLFEMAYEDKLDPYQYPVTKAYEMMSCFEGLLEYYRVTGIEKWKDAVIRFADRVAGSDITVIGCAGCTHELFDHSRLRQIDETEKNIMQETCVTVTWMKLCWQLLCLTGEEVYAGHMERSIYNALPGAVNSERSPLNGGLPFDSYSPLLPGTRGRKTGGFKVMRGGAFYGCCACIGAAGMGLTGMGAAVCAENGIYLNWYLPGVTETLTPQGNPVRLTTRTDYPLDGTVRVRVETEQAETFTLGVRIPAWSEDTMLSVNGERVQAVPGSYAEITREWCGAADVTLALDLRVKCDTSELCGVSSLEKPFISLRRGPLVLARDARLGDDVDSPIAPVIDEETGEVSARLRTNTPFPCMAGVDVELEDGRWLPMTDYASAGKTWSEESRMCAWSRRAGLC